MLSIDEIKELIKLIDESSIDEFFYQVDGEKLKLKKQTAPTYIQETVERVIPTDTGNVGAEPQTQSEPTTTEPIEIKASFDYEITSPMVGTFYLTESPDSDPYVSIGDQIGKGNIVCMIEAMKLFNEIESDVDGEVVEILAENGELVEYGQPLFGIKRK